MKKAYQITLLLYVATGISIGGYYNIYPNLHKVIAKSRAEILVENFKGPQFKEGNEVKTTLLITIVGAILIVGIGLITEKKDN